MKPKATTPRVGKHRRSSKRTNKHSISPRTAEDFFNMAESNQELWTQVTGAVSQMRIEGISRSKAARNYGLTPRQVQSLGGKALRKLKNGHYVAKSYDRLLRVVVIPSDDGPLEVATTDSREASRASRFSSAVELYLQTGDDAVLQGFRGQHVTDANGNHIPLLTDLHRLDQLGSAGKLSFESFYARSA